MAKLIGLKEVKRGDRFKLVDSFTKLPNDRAPTFTVTSNAQRTQAYVGHGYWIINIVYHPSMGNLYSAHEWNSVMLQEPGDL